MYDPSGKTVVTRSDIVAGLRALGVREGDLLQVHSSLSSLGYVVGGAETVVDALLEAVGPTGTVMVSTFNHGRVAIFDPVSTPSFNGAITEALRLRPQAVRSLHPTHPYAAIGPLAKELTDGHLGVITWGPDSPLGKLARRGGWVLLLGVGMNRNTAVHVGEVMARVPCIGYGQLPCQIRMPDGTVQAVNGDLWRNGPCRVEWDPVEERMREQGMIRDGRIGDAAVMLMKAQDAVQTAYELCQVYCPTCPTRPGLWPVRDS